MQNTTETDALQADLVIALLSVNKWSVEKCYGLYERLNGAELFDLRAVSQMTVRDIADRLNCAGYSRGQFLVSIAAKRLLDLAKKIGVGSALETLHQYVKTD